MIPLADDTKRRVGMALVVLIELFVVTSLVLYVAAGEAAAAVEVLVLGVTFGAVIAFSIRAQPQNGAVWALVWAALIGVSSDLGSSIAIHRDDVTGQEILDGTVSASPSDLDLLASIGLAAELVLWLPAIYLLAIHALLLFPSGRATSNRWRAVAFVTAGLMALQTVIGIVRIGPWQSTPYDELVDDTFGIFGPLAILQAILQLAAVAALVHLLRRYRRSAGEERLQFRWVAWALALFVGNFFLYWLWGRLGVAQLASTIVLVNIGVAFAVAIARYRLYDIDVIISKSVMYLGLLSTITAVYAAVVVVPWVVIGASDGDGPGLLLPIIATAVVAVMFEPLRARMQRWANRIVYGSRATPHEVLSRVTSRLAAGEGGSLDDVARLVAQGTGAEHAAVWLDTEGDLDVVGRWPAEDVSPETHPQREEHTAGVDVLYDHERLGVLTITKPRNDPITPADRELLDDIAAGAGLSLRNIHLNRDLQARAAEVRESRRRLIAAQDSERHRLERDLHDGAQQQVVALKVKLGIAKTVALREDADDIADRLIGLADETQEAVDALRRVAHGIYPPLLESDGLESALRAAERASGIPVELQVGDLDRYERSVEQTAYFCVTETLERARDSGAATARVELDGSNGDLVTEIDLGHLDHELDLRAVADRLDAAGGTLTVDDRPGRGRCVMSSLPLAIVAEPMR